MSINAADWHMSLGGEYFTWHENEVGGREVVEETGPRFFIEIGGREEPGSGDILTSFITRFYGAKVLYDGETTGAGAPVPVFSDSIYAGWATELKFDVLLTDSFHVKGEQSDWYLSTAIGYEEWLRDIKDAHVPGMGTISGYPEVYQVPYVKLGLNYYVIKSTNFNLGIKYPLVVNEEVGLTSQGFTNPILSPEPQPSLYASVIFRLSKSIGLHFFYDSYYFKASPQEILYDANGTMVTDSSGDAVRVYQPESHQDSVGVLVSIHF